MTFLLLGTIGTGKTSVGKEMARILGYDFIELDSLVLEHTGEDSIEAISPVFWKESELEVCKDLATEDNIVVSCGGGVVENDLNLLYFNYYKDSQVLIVYLEATDDTIITRMMSRNQEYNEDTLRKKIEDMRQRRENLFRHWAEYTVKTDDKTSEETAKHIIEYAQKFL